MQPTLDFSARGSVDRRPKGDALLPKLIVALTDRGWVSAKHLCQQLGTDDRTIREAASLSEGRVISGQKGYCLTHQASVEDVQRAAAWLRHQGTRMIERAIEIERAMHRRWEQAA